MNSTRKLHLFVGRWFTAMCWHQPQSLQYSIPTPSIPYCSKDILIKICRKFGSSSKSKSEEKEVHKVAKRKIPTSKLKEFLPIPTDPKQYARTLMKALDCGEEEFQKIQEKNIFWKDYSIDTVMERIEAFKGLGVQGSDLVENSTVIYEDFEHYYGLLKTLCSLLHFDGHELFPLLLLQKETIVRYLTNYYKDAAYLGDHTNRIKYFSTKLKVPVRNFTENCKDHLLIRQIRNIVKTMDFLLDAGISEEDIFNDLWVFQSGVKHAKGRLKVYQSAGINNIKPWQLRTSLKKFESSLKFNKIALSFDKNLSWTEFVAQTLNTSVEEAESLVKYDRKVEKVSFPKTKEVIDYLLSEGFTSKQILQSPQVFSVGVRRLNERIQILKEAGLEPVQHPEFLRRMAYSHQVFMDTLKNLKECERKDTTSVQKAS